MVVQSNVWLSLMGECMTVEMDSKFVFGPPLHEAVQLTQSKNLLLLLSHVVTAMNGSAWKNW
jgi:hypothetical protein